MKSLSTGHFILFFKDTQIINKSDIVNFYRHKENNLTVNTINWRTNELIRKKIIYRISRGKYSMLKPKKIFFEIPASVSKLYRILRKKYPDLNICIWNTSYIQNFISDRKIKKITFIETDKEKCCEIYLYLQKFIKTKYLILKSKNILDIIQVVDNPVVILPEIKESPVEKKRRIIIPTPEKILVDITSNHKLYDFKNKHEIKKLFYSLTTEHTFNENLMLRYASRRNRKENVLTLIKQE